MTDEEQPARTHAGSVYASAAAIAPRRGLRRRQLVAGATGAVAVIAGAYVLTTRLMESDQETLPEPAALAPLTTAATPGIDGTGLYAVPGNLQASRATRPAQTAKRAPSPTPSFLPSVVASPSETAAARLHAMVMRRIETVRNGTVRVSSARFDLTGQSDLTLAADEGHAERDGVRCTNRVRFSPDEPAATRNSLLLCWRTSGDRSVVTMAVAARGRPDPEDSIGIIEQEWAALD